MTKQYFWFKNLIFLKWWIFAPKIIHFLRSRKKYQFSAKIIVCRSVCYRVSQQSLDKEKWAKFQRSEKLGEFFLTLEIWIVIPKLVGSPCRINVFQSHFQGYFIKEQEKRKVMMMMWCISNLNSENESLQKDEGNSWNKRKGRPPSKKLNTLICILIWIAGLLLCFLRW